jgi:hypothetical protein
MLIPTVARSNSWLRAIGLVFASGVAQFTRHRQCTHREAPQAVLHKRTFTHVSVRLPNTKQFELQKAVAIAPAEATGLRKESLAYDF